MNARNVQRCHVIIHILWKMKWKLNADGSKKKMIWTKVYQTIRSISIFFYMHAFWFLLWCFSFEMIRLEKPDQREPLSTLSWSWQRQINSYHAFRKDAPKCLQLL